jgi:hypothetical protein
MRLVVLAHTDDLHGANRFLVKLDRLRSSLAETP